MYLLKYVCYFIICLNSDGFNDFIMTPVQKRVSALTKVSNKLTSLHKQNINLKLLKIMNLTKKQAFVVAK